MHPFLLLLGGAVLAYSETLGHTLLAGIVAVAGSILSVLAKRDKVPLLKSLPKFAPIGSSLSIVLSVLFLLAGAIAVGLPIALVTNTALRIFLPVLGWGLLAMFNTEDLTGIAPAPVASLLLLTGMLSCAHVAPVASCVETKLGPRGPVIVEQVESDLAQQDWADQLARLGPELGWDVLSCVLDNIEHTNADPVKVNRVKQFKTKNAAKLHA